ncbi:hypothetical protein I4U23_013689 [Adineta vaga]|nr:hypothetical protein I4U23_013689 [Adineta vaga]
MASSNHEDNRCKLLVLDIDSNQVNSDDIRRYFLTYGPIEWIEIFPKLSSAVIYFVSYLTVNRLVGVRTCFINQNQLRLRHFRPDETNWNIDIRTLRVKFHTTNQMNIKFTESTLFHCFKEYQSCIMKMTVYPNNHALLLFSDYIYVDQLLLLPINRFQIDSQPLILERLIRKNRLQQQQQQQKPMRDSVIEQLWDQIEYLSKQLREKPGNSRCEIERLQAELFVLKNENAQLKSKQNTEQHRTALIDISNKCSNERSYQKRWRSNSSERETKRHC